MWPLTLHRLRRRSQHRQISQPQRLSTVLLWGTVSSLSAAAWVGPALLPQSAQAQPVPTDISATERPPTFRYARGENVDLADIIAEWRGHYSDIPVYLCVCQDNTCDQTEQWPYREYYQYQLSVALGPNNGKTAEDAGSNCFDIADGSRPNSPRQFSEVQSPAPSAPPAIRPPARPSVSAPGLPPTRPPMSRPAISRPTISRPTVSRPTPDRPAETRPATAIRPIQADRRSAPSSPVMPATPITAAANPAHTNTSIPTVTVINEGAALRLDWPSGNTNNIAVSGSNWNVTVLDALDCASLSIVDEKLMAAQRVVGVPAVDRQTGNIAVPVLLDSCVETDQSAVFVVDPSEGGGYSLYRAQLPSVVLSTDRQPTALPNEFSSYAFNSITGIRYWDGALLVRQGTASGAAAIHIFRTGQTPAGIYTGCSLVTPSEGSNRLCTD